MHVLLADKLDPAAIAQLRELGCEVVSEPGLTADALPDRVPGFDVLVVRSTKVTEATLAAAGRLALVVRAGAGVENIDVAASAARGIYVCNVPGRNAVAVAELTMALLLALDRRIPEAVADLRDGRWRKTEYARADGLMGKDMGIVGLGEIGLCVAERAKAFGLSVHALARPGRTPEREARAAAIGVETVDSIDELFDAVAIVSLHVPGGPATRHLVDATLLDRLRPGAILLNTSRGEVVDEGALLEALDRGVRAGLDVYPDEPRSGEAEFDSALARHPNVVGTHHIGASTAQAQRAIASGVVEVVAAFARGELQWCTNLDTRPLGQQLVVVRHYDRIGVLAEVLGVLRRSEHNVEQMENRVFQGRTAAVASIRVAGPVSAETLAALEAIDAVIGVGLIADPGDGG